LKTYPDDKLAGHVTSLAARQHPEERLPPNPSLCRRLCRAILLLIPTAILLSIASATLQRDTPPGMSLARAPLAAGAPVPRIQCIAGYTPTLYAQGLSAPDGLAFGPDGLLYVAEESAGRVSMVGPTGVVTPVLDGLRQPEGIAVDGTLYVVEDVEGGRLIWRTAGGMTTTLAAGLDAPEGIVRAADGMLYITESNIEFVTDPFALRTGVTAVGTSGAVTRVITHTPPLTGGDPVRYWSYAGIAAGPGGQLYITNELSGIAVTQTVVLGPGSSITVTLFTTDSVFAVDPIAGTRTLFARGLVAPEGLRFSLGGGFPLYVAEEDLGGGSGRLSRVEADGTHRPLCTGFYTLEDVILDGRGNLYVSEEGGATGGIVRIEVPRRTVYLPAVMRVK
jgi:hypothetical protein